MAQSYSFWFLRQGLSLESRTWCLGMHAGHQDQEIHLVCFSSMDLQCAPPYLAFYIRLGVLVSSLLQSTLFTDWAISSASLLLFFKEQHLYSMYAIKDIWVYKCFKVYRRIVYTLCSFLCHFVWRTWVFTVLLWGFPSWWYKTNFFLLFFVVVNQCVDTNGIKK